MEKKKTTVYLDGLDRQAIAAIKQHYHVTSESAAIRLALALVAIDIYQREQPDVQETPRSENL